VTSPGEETSAARPALVTAGGLLLAVALLQIGQQVIGVFEPRPAIQVALIVATGLAALAVERRSGKVAIGGAAGAAVALVVAGVVWAAAGFSTPAARSIAEQVDAIRADLRRAGAKVSYRRLRLHQGPSSHVFVAAAPERSDEVRIYDDVRGSLKRRLAFRPDVRFERPAATAFRIRAVRDLDGDGQREILGAWEANLAGAELQQVPVLLRRSSSTARYAVVPLLPVISLGGPAVDGLPTLHFGSVESVWVSDFALVPGEQTLATTVVLPRGDPHGLALTLPGRIPKHVRFWAIDGPARARCVRGAARTIDADALGKPLAEAMAAAGVVLGDYSEGRCLEAPS